MKSKLRSLDWSMYATAKQIVEDNASLAFGQATGSPLETGMPNEVTGDRSFGVFTAETLLTIGQDPSTFLSPINKACRSLYSKYWSKNSSVSQFQEMDIGIYTLTSAQLFGLVSWLRTIYATLFQHNVNSEYVREGLLYALGVDAKDFTHHVNDLRGYINDLIVSLKGYVFDASIPLYAMMADEYSYMLLDAPSSTKTQYYVKKPAAALTYVKDTENIGSITYTDLSHATNGYLKYEKLIELVDSVMSAFFSSRYISQISAALEKALMEKDRFSLDYVKEDYRIDPFYDEPALLQIRNGVVLNNVNFSAITQDPVDLLLKQEATITANIENVPGTAIANYYGSKALIHAPDRENSKPEDVIVLSAYTAMMKLAQSGEFEAQGSVESHGLLVIKSAYIMGFTGAGVMTSISAPSFVVELLDQTTGEPVDTTSVARLMKATREFDFLPNTKILLGATDGSTTSYNTVNASEAEWFIPIDLQTCKKLHRSSVYAALGVPED